MDERAREVAGRLTAAQSRAVRLLDAQWIAGPDLLGSVANEMGNLREAGLVQREFADMHDPAFATSATVIAIRFAACWWFRLTPFGLTVRHILQQEEL
jgi:hypothetical protein